MEKIVKKIHHLSRKQFVPMAALGNDLVPLVECCHGVGEGDLKLLLYIYVYIYIIYPVHDIIQNCNVYLCNILI